MVSEIRLKIPKILKPINIKKDIEEVIKKQAYKTGMAVIWKDKNYPVPKIHLSRGKPEYSNKKQMKQRLEELFKDTVKFAKNKKWKGFFSDIEEFKREYLPDIYKVDFLRSFLREWIIDPDESILIPIKGGKINKAPYFTLIDNLDECTGVDIEKVKKEGLKLNVGFIEC